MIFSLTTTVQYCKFVDRNGVLKPSVRQASQLVFDYKADALGMIMCIQMYHMYSNIFILLIYSSAIMYIQIYIHLL